MSDKQAEAFLTRYAKTIQSTYTTEDDDFPVRDYVEVKEEPNKPVTWSWIPYRTELAALINKQAKETCDICGQKGH
jgi:hypothetical protein